MQALQAGALQVPYADSCLTRYLMDSMGSGRSRAVLIATCRQAGRTSIALLYRAEDSLFYWPRVSDATLLSHLCKRSWRSPAEPACAAKAGARASD